MKELTEKNNEGYAPEEKLQELYGALADLIPEALAEDFVGMGYAKGRYYDDAEKRILVVEKIPRPEKQVECCCGHDGHDHGHGLGREVDDKDFSRVVSRIARELLGERGEDWQEHTAWTYLYKLAPKTGKADDTIYRKQKALCEEIIKKEIEVLKPTHVLFFTGWGSVWDFDLPLSSRLKGEAVEAWGKPQDGTNYIVTRYAVRKPEDGFAMDILEKIKVLEELDNEGAGIDE